MEHVFLLFLFSYKLLPGYRVLYVFFFTPPIFLMHKNVMKAFAQTVQEEEAQKFKRSLHVQ